MATKKQWLEPCFEGPGHCFLAASPVALESIVHLRESFHIERPGGGEGKSQAETERCPIGKLDGRSDGDVNHVVQFQIIDNPERGHGRIGLPERIGHVQLDRRRDAADHAAAITKHVVADADVVEEDDRLDAGDREGDRTESLDVQIAAVDDKAAERLDIRKGGHARIDLLRR